MAETYDDGVIKRLCALGSSKTRLNKSTEGNSETKIRRSRLDKELYQDDYTS